MIISDFTEPELERFRTQCNFVNHEKGLFELRSKGYSLEEIAEQMNLTIDGAKKVSRKVNNKINKVKEHGVWTH